MYPDARSRDLFQYALQFVMWTLQSCPVRLRSVPLPGRTGMPVRPLALTTLILAACSTTRKHIPSESPSLRSGDPAPDFTATSLHDDSPASLTDYHGHVLLVNLWATWCQEELSPGPPAARKRPISSPFHLRALPRPRPAHPGRFRRPIGRPRPGHRVRRGVRRRVRHRPRPRRPSSRDLFHARGTADIGRVQPAARRNRRVQLGRADPGGGFDVSGGSGGRVGAVPRRRDGSEIWVGSGSSVPFTLMPAPSSGTAKRGHAESGERRGDWVFRKRWAPSVLQRVPPLKTPHPAPHAPAASATPPSPPPAPAAATSAAPSWQERRSAPRRPGRNTRDMRARPQATRPSPRGRAPSPPSTVDPRRSGPRGAHTSAARRPSAAKSGFRLSSPYPTSKPGSTETARPAPRSTRTARPSTWPRGTACPASSAPTPTPARRSPPRRAPRAPR